MSFCSIFVDKILHNNATMHIHFSYYEVKNFKPLKWFNHFIDSRIFFCMTKHFTRKLPYLYKLHFYITPFISFEHIYFPFPSQLEHKYVNFLLDKLKIFFFYSSWLPIITGGFNK